MSSQKSRKKRLRKLIDITQQVLDTSGNSREEQTYWGYMVK